MRAPHSSVKESKTHLPKKIWLIGEEVAWKRESTETAACEVSFPAGVAQVRALQCDFLCA